MDSKPSMLLVFQNKYSIVFVNMYAENQEVDSHTKGLLIRGMNTPVRISLPVSHSHNLTPAVAKRWPSS